jgi:hypothetical protein
VVNNTTLTIQFSKIKTKNLKNPIPWPPTIREFKNISISWNRQKTISNTTKKETICQKKVSAAFFPIAKIFLLKLKVAGYQNSIYILKNINPKNKTIAVIIVSTMAKGKKSIFPSI